MISRRTCNVPKDVIFPRLLYSDSRCFQACRWRSQVLPGLASALPGLSFAHPGLSSAPPDVLSALPGLWSALTDMLPALPGAPRCTQCSLRRSEVFSNLSQLLPWHSCSSHQRSQFLRRPAGMPSYSLIISCNWRVQVYTQHHLRHSLRLPVTKIHFADGYHLHWSSVNLIWGVERW